MSCIDNPVHEEGCKHGVPDEQVCCAVCGELCDNRMCAECDELGRADQQMEEDR